MKKDVTITLWSQRDGEEPVELTTAGTLERREDGARVLCYQGEAERNTVTVEPGRVTVERLGDIRYQMVFEAGKRNSGRYETPYGVMEMAVVTHSLQTTLDGMGEISIEYHLDFGGVAAERTQLRLTVK